MSATRRDAHAPTVEPDAREFRAPGRPAVWQDGVEDLREGLRLAAGLRRRMPDWVLALAIFVASRLFDGFLIARNAWLAGTRPDGRGYTYLDMLPFWDGTWYREIILHGYPDHLPIDSLGHVAQNTLAFYPLYPALVAAAMHATGWSFAFAASAVSVGFGALAAVGVQKLVAAVAGRRLALWAVLLLCFFPAGAVFQLPYAESLSLALLVGVLLCLQRRHYLLAVPLVLLVGLARPIGVPLAVVVLVHALRVVVRRARGSDPLPARSVVALGALVVASAVGAVEWPLAVAVRTGRLDAYTQTMAAWRNPRRVVPFVPWHDAAERYLGSIGVLVLVATIGALAWWLLRPAASVIAGDMRVWCISYAAYLLAAMDSFTSLSRYLLPLFPLGVLLASVSRDRAYRVAVAVAFAAGCVMWIVFVWRSKTMAP